MKKYSNYTKADSIPIAWIEGKIDKEYQLASNMKNANNRDTDYIEHHNNYGKYLEWLLVDWLKEDE